MAKSKKKPKKRAAKKAAKKAPKKATKVKHVKPKHPPRVAMHGSTKVTTYGGTCLVRGAKKDGARFVGTRNGVDWWAYPGDDYREMCHAFDAGKTRK